MLFGSGRDASFVRKIGREVMQRVIGVEVLLFKIALGETAVNLYGESSSKKYHAPVRVYALVENNDSTLESAILDLNRAKTIRVGLLRDDLVDIQLSVDPGDILRWDEKYFEVDNTTASDYWVGRNPDTLIAYNTGEVPEHGYSVSIMLECHLTSVSTLDIIDERSGNNPVIENVYRNL